MKSKKLWKVGLISVIAGVIATGIVSAETRSFTILRAKTAIEKGQPLTRDLFEETEVQTEESWMVKPEMSFAGLTARHDLAANEYLSKSDLSGRRVVMFAPNEREFTVQTDLSRCVGGDLATGDLADVLFFDKETVSATPIFTVSILEVKNRSGNSLQENTKEVRDTVPATVKIKVTTEQAAALLAFEQRGLIAFAKVPADAGKSVDAQ